MSAPVSIEYSVNLKSEKLNNKIYRIFFIDIDRQLLPYFHFKLQYKCIDDISWQSVRSFDCRACRIWKKTNEIFTYIRVPSKLYDYTMNIRLSLRSSVNIIGIKCNEWMKYGDILSIKVLSSLESVQFSIGCFVKFRPPHCDEFHYGKIEEISSDSSTNKDNQLLNVCSIKDYDSGNVWTNIPIKILLQLLANDYIDFCVENRNYADFEILFRSNNLNNDMIHCNDNQLNEENQFNIYCTLIECGMLYAQHSNDQFQDEYDGEISINAKSRCFAFNVMNMLCDNIKNYNLKLNCLKDCGCYLYTKSINTIIECRINNKLPSGWSYGCDVCRSSVNEFDFMFHCDNIAELKHDFCVLCVYEMIKKYRYFTEVLNPILLNTNILNAICIDVLVTFLVGRTIQFKYDEDEINEPPQKKQRTMSGAKTTKNGSKQ